jgi:hypothetical protein
MAVTRDRRAMIASLPLLDSTGHVRGALINVGGERRRTAWYPAAAAGPRWSTIGDRLRALDSVTGRRTPPMRRTALRAVSVDRGMLYLQPVFALPVDDAPAFAYVAVLTADSARKFGPARREGAIVTGDLRGQVEAIYTAMRAALQRNDWIAFGRAMDALSRVAGNPGGGRK